MKVIEKYLNMSIEEQKNDLFDAKMRLTEYDTIDYLNSEVEQDPLEKLGYEKVDCGYELHYTKYINEYLTDEVHIPIKDVEERIPKLKAILEIMEGMK